MTSKPKAGRGSKNCIAWKVEKDVHDFVHADKVAAAFWDNIGKLQTEITESDNFNVIYFNAQHKDFSVGYSYKQLSSGWYSHLN